MLQFSDPAPFEEIGKPTHCWSCGGTCAAPAVGPIPPRQKNSSPDVFEGEESEESEEFRADLNEE